MGLLADYLPDFLPSDPNQNQAARQGLLQFGAALLGGRGNFGSILGQGIQAGAGGYNSALQALQQKALMDAQTQHLGLENQAAQAQIDAPSRIASILSDGTSAPVPAAAMPLVMGGPAPLSKLPQMSQAPDAKPLSMIPQASMPDQSTPPPVAAQAPAAAPQAPAQADLFTQYMGMGDKLSRAGYPTQAKNYYDLAQKLKPEVQEVKTAIDPVSKQPVQVITFKDGSQKTSSYGALPDNQVVDLGGSQGVLDKNTGKMGTTFAKSQTPDSIATVAEAARGHTLQHQDAQETALAPEYKQDINGNWVALPKKVAPGQPIKALPVLGADGKPMNAAPKPLTESQGKATTFAARMLDAEQTIGKLEKSGVKGSDYATIAAGSPLTNWYATPNGQMYRQAQENWVTANLRQESGAAIGKDEMDKDIRKFFPTVGDSKEVIAQKAHSREIAARGMLAQAGPGADSAKQIVASVQPVANLPKNPPGAPQPGMVQNGYRFKGGNPADKSNWEKL